MLLRRISPNNDKKCGNWRLAHLSGVRMNASLFRGHLSRDLSELRVSHVATLGDISLGSTETLTVNCAGVRELQQDQYGYSGWSK